MRTVALAAALAALAFPSLARADNKQACIAASELGQKLEGEHKLLAARAQFLACSRDACPGVIKKDCIDALAAVDRRTPSVVVRAKDAKGEDLVVVQVDVDGARVAESLDGKALPLDPGVHEVRLSTAGEEPVVQRLVLVEGERERAVVASFGKPEPKPVDAPPAPKRGAPLGAFVVGGAGLLSIGAGLVFYGVGLGERSSAIATGCATTADCEAVKGSVRAKLAVGDIFTGVGVVAVVTSVVWTIVHYSSGPSAPAAAHTLDVEPVAGGARATLRLRF